MNPNTYLVDIDSSYGTFQAPNQNL